MKSTEMMTRVVPGTPRWEELVTMGIIKDGARNWFLGDAALEIYPAEDPALEAEANLALYGARIGVSLESLEQYRKVAASWPESTRLPGASWKVHEMFMKPEQRNFLLEETAKSGGRIITVTVAHELKQHSTAGRPGVRAAAKTANDVKKLLTDPVVRSIFEDQPSLIAALPKDVVREFIKSQGADQETEALVSELRKELRKAQEENETLLAKVIENPANAIAQERDDAKARADEVEAKLEAALVVQGRLEEAADRSTTAWNEQWKKNQETLKGLKEDLDEQKKLAKERAQELAELKAADPERQDRVQRGLHYRKIEKALFDLAAGASGLERLLNADPLNATGDHQEVLLQLVDETLLHLQLIRSKLGAEWNASEAAGNRNRHTK